MPGSWPILLPTLAVGFVLGALWHRAHARDLARNRKRFDIDRLITPPPGWQEEIGTYALSGDDVPYPRTETSSPPGSTGRRRVAGERPIRVNLTANRDGPQHPWQTGGPSRTTQK